MQGNDGRALEQLVGLIEGHLLPSGFKVETRKPVYDEAGVPLAEFDILITGHVGTAHLSWLIECRDRPADGPAPAAWIEQLIGRRARFRFDKVMAVSSTGFAKSAIGVASDGGIELRALENLTYDAVARCLPRFAPMIVHDGRFSAVRAYICDANAPDNGNQRMFSIDDPILVGSESGEKLSIRELWRKVINSNSVWRDVAEGGPPIETTVNALDHLTDSYSMVVDGRMLPIDALVFDASLHAYFPNMPLAEAAHYSSASSDADGKAPFVRLGRWTAPEGSPIKELIFIGYLKRSSNVEDDS